MEVQGRCPRVATKKKNGSGKAEIRGKVSARYNFSGGTSSPRDGWVLPGELQVHAELPDGIHVHVDVVVVEGRAKARSVTVSALLEHGVGWQALSKTPVRDIVAVGVLDALRKVTTYDDGTVLGILLPREKDMDEVNEIIQATVGYRPRTEGFERVNTDAS
jgi:hypothetical protein